MPQSPLYPPNWTAFADRVQGYSHQKEHRICQDDFWFDQDDRPRPIVRLAVADGHGSAKSPKSHLGAEVAVKVVKDQLDEFALGTSGMPTDVVKRYAEEKLAELIVRRWVARVREIEPLRNDLARLLLEYGSTLLATMITPAYILYLQLGDGDILRVSGNGEVIRPIPRNPALIANETTSLSMVDSKTGQPIGWQEMTIVVEPLTSLVTAPALITVSTDGYANSFRTEADFLQAGRDFLVMLRTRQWEKVKQELAGWLGETSKQGSGDDIALGLLWNRPLVLTRQAKDFQ